MTQTRCENNLAQVESNINNFLKKGPWAHWPTVKKEIVHLESSTVLQKFKKMYSILIPLVERKDGVYTLMTTRTFTVSQHKGEVCFPGGKMEQSDASFVHTALREAEEEIGLPPTSVRVIGTFYNCSANYECVIIVVGIITDPDFIPILSTNEVADYFYCPLDFFLSTSHFNEIIMTHLLLTDEKNPVDVPEFHYSCPHRKISYKIWGLTGISAAFIASIGYDILPDFKLYSLSCDMILNSSVLRTYIMLLDKGNNQIVFYLNIPHKLVIMRSHL